MEKQKKGVRLEHISKIYKDPKTGKEFYAVQEFFYFGAERGTSDNHLFETSSQSRCQPGAQFAVYQVAQSGHGQHAPYFRLGHGWKNALAVNFLKYQRHAQDQVRLYFGESAQQYCRRGSAAQHSDV